VATASFTASEQTFLDTYGMVLAQLGRLSCADARAGVMLMAPVWVGS